MNVVEVEVEEETAVVAVVVAAFVVVVVVLSLNLLSWGKHATLATSGKRIPRSINSSRVARTEIFRSRPEISKKAPISNCLTRPILSNGLAFKKVASFNSVTPGVDFTNLCEPRGNSPAHRVQQKKLTFNTPKFCQPKTVLNFSKFERHLPNNACHKKRFSSHSRKQMVVISTPSVSKLKTRVGRITNLWMKYLTFWSVFKTFGFLSTFPLPGFEKSSENGESCFSRNADKTVAIAEAVRAITYSIGAFIWKVIKSFYKWPSLFSVSTIRGFENRG